MAGYHISCERSRAAFNDLYWPLFDAQSTPFMTNLDQFRTCVEQKGDTVPGFCC
jgi:hypothetical protein